MSGAVQRSNQGPFLYSATATLPASGAYTTGATVGLPEYVTKANLVVTYTRGAVGGYAVLRPVWKHVTGVAAGSSADTLVLTTAFDTSIAAAPTVTGQYARVPLGILEIKLPTPDGAGALTFEVPLVVPGGAKFLRVDAAEAGVTATPGTFKIEYSTFSE